MNGFGPQFFAQVYFDPKSGIAGEFFTTGQFRSMTALDEFVTRTFERMLQATGRSGSALRPGASSFLRESFRSSSNASAEEW